jgi:uncharacterized protein DUF4239
VDTWLLDHLSTWEIALVLPGGLTVVALAGFWLVLRVAPNWRHQEGPDIGNTFRGVGVSIFVIALAFSIVTLYQSYAATSQSVRDEAAELAQFVRDADAFPPATRAALRKSALLYIQIVDRVEWPNMRAGKATDQTSKPSFDAMYRVLLGFEPKTQSQRTFYDQEVQQVNDLIAARRDRLSHEQAGLPGVFEVLLLFGTGLAVFTTYIPRSNSMTLSVATVAFNALFIGVALFVAVQLSHPFDGSYAVGDKPFFQGALERLVQAGR